MPTTVDDFDFNEDFDTAFSHIPLDIIPNIFDSDPSSRPGSVSSSIDNNNINNNTSNNISQLLPSSSVPSAFPSSGSASTSSNLAPHQPAISSAAMAYKLPKTDSLDSQMIKPSSADSIEDSSPLFSEHESLMITQFFDKINQDTDFLFDPKLDFPLAGEDDMNYSINIQGFPPNAPSSSSIEFTFHNDKLASSSCSNNINRIYNDISQLNSSSFGSSSNSENPSSSKLQPLQPTHSQKEQQGIEANSKQRQLKPPFVPSSDSNDKSHQSTALNQQPGVFHLGKYSSMYYEQPGHHQFQTSQSVSAQSQFVSTPSNIPSNNGHTNLNPNSIGKSNLTSGADNTATKDNKVVSSLQFGTDPSFQSGKFIPDLSLSSTIRSRTAVFDSLPNTPSEATDGDVAMTDDDTSSYNAIPISHPANKQNQSNAVSTSNLTGAQKNGSIINSSGGHEQAPNEILPSYFVDVTSKQSNKNLSHANAPDKPLNPHTSHSVANHNLSLNARSQQTYPLSKSFTSSEELSQALDTLSKLSAKTVKFKSQNDTLSNASNYDYKQNEGLQGDPNNQSLNSNGQGSKFARGVSSFIRNAEDHTNMWYYEQQQQMKPVPKSGQMFDYGPPGLKEEGNSSSNSLAVSVKRTASQMDVSSGNANSQNNNSNNTMNHDNPDSIATDASLGNKKKILQLPSNNDETIIKQESKSSIQFTPVVSQQPQQPQSPGSASPLVPSDSTSIKLDKTTSPSASKSAGSSAKKSRAKKNLTEDQKRINHISSEKRRRNMIKIHFQQMCSLVPKLADDISLTSGGSTDPENGNIIPPKTGGSVKGSNKSKSVVLNTVYDYLIYMIEKNQKVRDELTKNGVDVSHIPKSFKEKKGINE